MYAKVCCSLVSENVIENFKLKSNNEKTVVKEAKELIKILNNQKDKNLNKYTLLEICSE